eukprot:250859-Lingulodinium_polyedra.AAC.1
MAYRAPWPHWRPNCIALGKVCVVPSACIWCLAVMERTRLFVLVVALARGLLRFWPRSAAVLSVPRSVAA